MEIENKEYEMLSVSEVARRVGKTPQTIYNQIRAKQWDVIEYQRGQYKGLLVKFPKE